LWPLSSGELARLSIYHHHVTVALMVGNETFGVLPETLALCDEVAELPMWGVNKSLNVIVSAAIAAYHATAQIDLAHP
jgi:tRNA G18 (ribose-2'-O)-methylase SpoU